MHVDCRDDTVSTENLTTLFAVVPKSGKGEWLGNYEQLSDFVVRLSSQTQNAEPAVRA